MRNDLLALVAVPLAIASASGLAAQDIEIKEWPVPWERTRPRDPFMDAQNRVWFVGQQGNYIAYLVPATDEFKRYEIEAGTNPHNLIVDPRGIVWYAGNRNARIGRLDPATGQIKTFMMPDTAARDPHTLVFDSRGDIWFTVQGGGFIGKLTVASGDVKLIKVPGGRTLPYGIRMDSQDRPWVVLFGTNKLATVDPKTMELRLIDLPRAETRPRRIEVTSDGMVWYVDYAAGQLGRYNPANGQIKEWLTPGGAGSRPYATATDDVGRIWFVESGAQPNQFVGFDPKTEKFFGITPVPSGGGTVRHMMFHKPSREIWFGADTNTIGRARLITP
ncbi:MAG: virginiamycin B lyase family protein [Longimicrobiales bacterium]